MLDALGMQSLTEPYELIVVDDGSKDDTAEIARRAGAMCFTIPPSGPAAARNYGAQRARGEILLFTDADCVPAMTWAAELSSVFRDVSVVGAKGVYKTSQSGLIPRFVQAEYASKYERMARQSSIDFIDTYSAAYRRDIFLANGGFDIAFPAPSVEDQEFSFRLAKKGYRLVLVPKAVVYHRHDLTLREYAVRKFWIGYWKAVLLRRHPEKVFGDSHTPPSQRWQIALLGLAGLGAMLGGSSPIFFALSLLGLIAFALSAIPFMIFIARYDRLVLLAAPLLLLTRAAALGAGLMMGFLGVRRLGTSGVLSMRQRIIKRTLDVVCALIGLIFLGPFILFLALAIKLDSAGAAFFIQERIGENGRRFKMIKLRSMRASAERERTLVMATSSSSSPILKISDDPRVTRLGRWLRRWVWMSCPVVERIARRYEFGDPDPKSRLLSRDIPIGIVATRYQAGANRTDADQWTGLLSLDERVRLELNYIENYSIGLDLKILIKTIPPSFGPRRGAFLDLVKSLRAWRFVFTASCLVGASHRHDSRCGTPIPV